MQVWIELPNHYRQLIMLATRAPPHVYTGLPRPRNATPGTWVSASPYLGRELTGEYYLSNDLLYTQSCQFYDSGSDEVPFLKLFNFQPYYIPIQAQGEGQLRNTGPSPVSPRVLWFLAGA
jgi:hypothetical protein